MPLGIRTEGSYCLLVNLNKAVALEARAMRAFGKLRFHSFCMEDLGFRIQKRRRKNGKQPNQLQPWT